jgi:hypothetical protein
MPAKKAHSLSIILPSSSFIIMQRLNDSLILQKLSHISDLDNYKLDTTVYPNSIVEAHLISNIAQGLRKAAVAKTWRTKES